MGERSCICLVHWFYGCNSLLRLKKATVLLKLLVRGFRPSVLKLRANGFLQPCLTRT